MLSILMLERNIQSMNKIKWCQNKLPKNEDSYLHLLNPKDLTKVHTFHESFPQYKETPLISLNQLATNIKVGNIFIKDESFRFGLNAFKVLGGSYAIGQYIAHKLEKDISHLPYSILTSDELRNSLGPITFFTATDGNHGRGVAWSANKLGQQSVVYMPMGTTQTRLNHLLKEGSPATIESCNYDDCVRKAQIEASKITNAVIVQDTAWEGYEEIPTWIMQGYTTMAMEASEQLDDFQCTPTHIFIQAGVGSLAASIQGYFTNKYKDKAPKVIVVESDVAACLYESALACDGNPKIVDGDMLTLMNGLACGEPCTIGWDILKNHAHTFIACPDWVTKLGMRLLAKPLDGDSSIVSGESGAVTTGLLYTIMTNPEYESLRALLELNESSHVLLFSTEGDTDPEQYKKCVYGVD